MRFAEEMTWCVSLPRKRLDIPKANVSLLNFSLIILKRRKKLLTLFPEAIHQIQKATEADVLKEVSNTVTKVVPGSSLTVTFQK